MDTTYMTALNKLRDECAREVDREQGIRDDEGDPFNDALVAVLELRPRKRGGQGFRG